MESRQRRRKPASGALVLATQFLDPLWPIFVLTGIERVTISPGITRATPLNFEFYPYSHSLLAACPWSLIAGGIYFFARRSKTAAWGGRRLRGESLGARRYRASSRPPVAPGVATRIGLGLWNCYPATILVEVVLLLGGVLIYMRRTKPQDRIGSIGLQAFILFLLTACLGRSSVLRRRV
jgi:hypothetical protein